MSWQRSFWFRVPLSLTKQLKWDNAGHGEVTINIIILYEYLLTECGF